MISVAAAPRYVTGSRRGGGRLASVGLSQLKPVHGWAGSVTHGGLGLASRWRPTAARSRRALATMAGPPGYMVSEVPPCASQLTSETKTEPQRMPKMSIDWA